MSALIDIVLLIVVGVITLFAGAILIGAFFGAFFIVVDEPFYGGYRDYQTWVNDVSHNALKVFHILFLTLTFASIDGGAWLVGGFIVCSYLSTLVVSLVCVPRSKLMKTLYRNYEDRRIAALHL